MLQRKDPWIVANLAAVAAFFNVHHQTARRWRIAGMPGSQGQWDLAAILRWRDGRGTAKEDLSPRNRNYLAKAEITEARLHLLRRSLVDVEAVRRLFTEHVAQAESVLGRLPDDVLAAIPPNTPQRRELRAVVEKTVGYAQQVLHDALDSLTPS